WGDMLVWDTPAWETLPRREAKNAVTEADLIVWVSHSGNIDNVYEASQLRRLERWLTSRSGQPQSPLLVALTHGEAADADTLKSTTAINLGVARERIIAISLAHPESSDTGSQLRQAIAAHQHQASRSKHWRHFYQRKSHENREFIGRQLRNAGSGAWRMAKGVFTRNKKNK
ncbi:MAG TPA: hypothetical protein VGP45_06620, partial [Marinobacter sp.]|nr:hypothetical protein [Marinobacter sp.]